MGDLELECKRVQRYVDRMLLLTTSQFARAEDVSADTIRRRANRGVLPCIRVPSGLLFPSAAVSRRASPVAGDHVQDLLAE